MSRTLLLSRALRTFSRRRAAIGSEAQFNCVVGRDASFLQRRFPTSWEAANYWYVLYSQELGVSLQPIPAPSS
jgi:hypothetical protein